MPRGRKRTRQDRFDFHIWLSAELKEALEKVAERECRSISKQVEYYVRSGLWIEPPQEPKP